MLRGRGTDLDAPMPDSLKADLARLREWAAETNFCIWCRHAHKPGEHNFKVITEVRNNMNITKETAPVGTRVLILDESDIIREASVAEYSPEGRVKMQFDTWTQWFTTVNVNVLEILDADANTNASESLQSCLVALQEIYEDSEQFSVLGVRTAIKRLLRDHGVYVPTEFRYPTE